MDRYDEKLRKKPFSDYNEFMQYVFDCVNIAIDSHITKMKGVFASGQGGYKNVLYPDIEVAADVAKEKLLTFHSPGDDSGKEEEGDKNESKEDDEDDDLEIDEELLSLFSSMTSDDEEGSSGEAKEESALKTASEMTSEQRIEFIKDRAALAVKKGVSLPLFELSEKLGWDDFTLFCFSTGLLSSTQTDYAGVFQVINENGGLSSPTVESAARLYYQNDFSVTRSYGEMSTCIEQLLPILSLEVRDNMPFSTPVSPDKRIIDFLFGKNPMKLDENFIRFFSMITKENEELDPVLANQNVLDAMKISYDDGVRIFFYHGDEGSGRKFFVKHFCKEKNLRAVAMNCKKLFSYDFRFVEKALWAVTRECILTDSVCCLTELSYSQEEKEKFEGYMDLAFAKLTEKDITVFAMSKDTIDLREVTKQEFTALELPTPTNEERIACWEYFGKNFTLDKDCDVREMSNKFLFTPGKIHGALRAGKSFATMEKSPVITRANLFKGCNNQMSSELSQKASRVEAKFGFDDIVMNEDQRETITHAIEQMNFKKQVYDDWNYTRKYPYGRGLTVLLFGAPGTGKSMMAQVLAHELNLELYRVDISKVVDKYVGETEKSLSMIFREAKKCNVVLFFDECDTIFAKRSDDGGSNQASANNKTALLLQEMEAYDGVCVLATNYKHNIDPAFFRRMKYIVEFQFSNPDTREMLWKTTVPKTTPLDEDVDFRFLAEKYEFAGGNIKNCILNAAFLAAADETAKGKVCMRHYLRAIKYEFIKVGKVFTKSDFEPYADQVGLA